MELVKKRELDSCSVNDEDGGFDGNYDDQNIRDGDGVDYNYWQ